MKKIFAILFALAMTAAFANAQSVEVNGRLFVLNQGDEGSMGSLGYYEYPCGDYVHLDSLPAGGEDLEFNNGVLYAVAGGNIYGWNVENNFEEIVVIENAGAIDIDVAGRFLIAACVEAPFVKAFDLANNYEQAFTANTDVAPNEAGGVLILNNNAFVTLNGRNGNGVNGEVDNTLLILNLGQLQATLLEIQDNPIDMIVAGDMLYVNALSFDEEMNATMIISEFDLSAGEIGYNEENNHVVEVANGIFQEKDGLLYVAGRESMLAYDPQTREAEEVAPNNDVSAFLPDPQYNAFHVATSNGETGAFGPAAEEAGSFMAHAMPSALLMDNDYLLGPDYVVCGEDSNFVQLLVDAENYASINWWDMSEEDSALVRESGDYFVELTDEIGCVSVDTVNITFSPLPEGEFDIPEDTLMLEENDQLQYQISVDTPGEMAFWLVSMNGSNFQQLGVINTQFPFRFQAPGNYVFLCVLVNENGCIRELRDTVYVETFTSRSEPEWAEQLRVFPNPASDYVRVLLPVGKQAEFDRAILTDISGKAVVHVPVEFAANEQLEINATELASGIYFLRLEFGEVTITRKLIVN